ncbi:hypothetical protein QZH41_019252 [Actinostola sp. cb2023]|nr:hypothetical protein QZH41_019252 [Actinostola sp. cb2023]
MASDSIYPTLPELSSGEDYRLKRIADVQTSIELELGHYEQVLKKYKRAHSGLSQYSLFCGGCTVVLSGGSLASAMTGFGIVAGAPLADEKVVFCTLTPFQEDVYVTLLQSPDVKLITRKDFPCDCGSGNSRGKCCYKVNHIMFGRGSLSYKMGFLLFFSVGHKRVE